MHLSTALVALGATVAAALPQIEVKGNQFYFAGNGSEFKIRGLAYQPGGQSAFKGDGDDKHDPLSVADICKRDAAVIQSLGANVIRVYNLHPDLNHDECVTVFNNAGIYLMLDVNSPLVNSHINKEDPSESYHMGYLEHVFSVIDAFKGYDNVIGFFAGNEIIDTKKQSKENPPYIRAVTRDMRKYIKKHSDRFIAVGYAATDTRSAQGAGKDSVTDLWNYLRCSDDEEDDGRSDFFAVNIYSWCGDAKYEASGYPELVEDFKDTSLPIFWSEFGCNEPSPREFNEVPAMYGKDEMITTFAGGVVFEYSQEPNNFGLVEIEKNGDIKLRDDFHALSKQYDSVDWTKIKNIKQDKIKVVEPPKCSAVKILGSGFAKDFSEVPKMPNDAGGLMDDGSGNKNVGKLLGKDIKYDSKYKIMDGGKDVTKEFSINVAPDADVSDAPSNKDGSDSKDGDSAAGHIAAGLVAVVAPMAAALALLI